MTREGYLKHKELIEAWVNGAEIEYFVDIYRYWDSTESPSWHEHIEYRIKPEQTIAEWLAENNSDYVPNWEDADEEKYFIFKNCTAEGFDRRWDLGSNTVFKSYETTYMSKETARKLVNLLKKGEVIE